MADDAYTNPRKIDWVSTERAPIGVDVAPLLETGETPTTPVCKLEDSAGELYAAGLDGVATIASNIVRQGLRDLVRGNTYLLTTTVTVGTNKQRAVLTEILVVK